jgi:hypothetical protein
MTFKDLVEIYGGWAAFALFFLYTKVWPLIENRIIPEGYKLREKEREARLEELRARSAIEDEDRKFRQEIERERLAGARQTQEAITRISEAMVQTNERIAIILQNQVQIQANQAALMSTLNDGITDMREEVALRRGREEGKHLPKTGPLDEKKVNP